MSDRRLTRTMTRGLIAGLCSTALLSGCATAEPATSPATSPAIPGDGTWKVGTDVAPGVYVGAGGSECRYYRLGDLDAGHDDVIVRGFLNRPVIEIMEGDGGFRTEGCGAWIPIDGYAGPEGSEIPGDGIWLVGEDVVAGTYEAEGGEWCMWQRLSAFEPEWSSVIKGGSNARATLAAGDVAFMTEGCGTWTRIG